MVAADIVLLITVLGLMGIGGKSLFSAWAQARENGKVRRADEANLRDDLRRALSTHKRRDLEDFMVIWGDKLPKEVHEHVRQRIDELLIEE
jgi:hypothetical protein